MRRIPSLLIVCAVLAGACADDAPPDAQIIDEPIVSSTTTTTIRSTTSTTSTFPSSTTTAAEGDEVRGMCGDLIPVVTDNGTNCVDPDAPITTTTIDPAEWEWPGEVFPDSPLPPLLVADGREIARFEVLDDGTLEHEPVMEAAHPVTDLHQAPDGTIFTREWEEISEDETVIEFARYRPDGTRTVIDIEELYDVGVIDGVAVVIGAVESADGFGFGGVKAFAVDDLREIADFALGAEAEFGVTDFRWNEATAIGVVSAWSDLTEWIGFVTAPGQRVDRPSPTDDLPYNSPPYVTAGALSIDGATLYWAEGPDWGYDAATGESGPVAAEWVLHGADVATGDERLRWPLSEPVVDLTVLNIHSIEDLGDQILVNRTALRGTNPVALAPLILDFTTEEPDLVEFPAFGVATRAAIDR